MKSAVTSYNALFSQRRPDVPAVDRIEIPLLQRDYAQGRQDANVARIRADFLDVLCGAVAGGPRVSLDFVYGDVDAAGTLRPLDGQQRLTTLFLLHWYLAFRAGRMDEEQGWKRFSYATRPSARLFCERLPTCPPPPDEPQVAVWIRDQPWYLHTWRHDPTIQSMLVMIDAIDERLRGVDPLAAWKRLVDPRAPAIEFHLLPVEGLGLTQDLYIKMNARGKPLTSFENFKARFEQTLEAWCPQARVDELGRKFDVEWSSVLWPYKGDDNIIDDECLRYFHFVASVCAWRAGRQPAGEIGRLADDVFRERNPDALDFLFHAFDTWVDTDIAKAFAGWFTAGPSPDETRRVVLFSRRADVDLFGACCRHFGKPQEFTGGQTLLLYAVLVHRREATDDFARRLRVLRNLVEASSSEIRAEAMPALLDDVERLVKDGALADVKAFNRAQVADEQRKAVFLDARPDLEETLWRLEDHDLLRGNLAAFELDGAVFARRAAAFHRVFADEHALRPLTGALLACGDYARRLNRRFTQFGSGRNREPWRDLFTGAGRAQLAATRDALGRLLDEISGAQGSVVDALEGIREAWVDSVVASNGLDWRWYFARYACMRQGRSGLYVGEHGELGYGVCMLDKIRMSSDYGDPYLLAVWKESGVGQAVVNRKFTGYEDKPRWMELAKSGAALRCVDEGIAIRPPLQSFAAFAHVCATHGVGPDHVLRVPQIARDGRLLDTQDRVQLGAVLLRDLVAAGL